MRSSYAHAPFLEFINIFYHDFAKIYGPPETLQNYTSVVVAVDAKSAPHAKHTASRTKLA
jgi:hypothetical protein